MSLTPTSMMRLDNNRWAFIPTPTLAHHDQPLVQIQISTPTTTVAGQSFELARFVGKILKQKQIHLRSQLTSSITFEIKNPHSSVRGRWRITLDTHHSLLQRILQFFPFTATIYNKHIAQISVTKDSFWTKLTFSKHVPYVFSEQKKIKLPATDVSINPNETIKDRLEAKPFDDAFTRLATSHLQTVDPYWVSEMAVQAAYRFVLTDDNRLQLVKILSTAPTAQEIEENKKVARFYRDFIKQEFGERKLAYVDTAFGFSLDAIIEKGLSLVPDHIFKMNIGMNSIELADVQRLYDKLLAWKKASFAIAPARFGAEDYFSIREFRKVIKEKFTDGVEVALPTVERVQDLPIDAFNRLVDILMPTDEERERAYTGRKITSLAISGQNTMGIARIYNPSRNLFELMQVMPLMQKTEDWENYFVLLAHVAAKKSLFLQSTPQDKREGDKEWHVGLLLPAPNSADGAKRYYYVDAFFDDGKGSVSYALLPACNHYRYNDKACPFIKDFRGTCSNESCIDYLESLDADINPYGSPGSLDPESLLNVQQSYFNQRTLPLWAGYLIASQKQHLAEELSHASIKASLDEYLRCLNAPGATPREILEKAKKLKESQDVKATYDFLMQEADKHRELPQYKIAQDIVSIGHSLGGGLSQFSIYYYGVRRSRIPLPNNNYYCFESHGTAINTRQDALFMRFGRKNRDLLALLNQKWGIRHSLAFGDPLPQAGQSHLGTIGYDATLDDLWLDPKISVFTPLETAEALVMTTLSCHERRLDATAIPNRDYSIRYISSHALHQFDHSWWMGAEQNRIWGYRILRSSKLLEGIRASVSKVIFPFTWLALRIQNRFWPSIIRQRNAAGAVYIRYKKPRAI